MTDISFHFGINLCSCSFIYFPASFPEWIFHFPLNPPLTLNYSCVAPLIVNHSLVRVIGWGWECCWIWWLDRRCEEKHSHLISTSLSVCLFLSLFSLSLHVLLIEHGHLRERSFRAAHCLSGWVALWDIYGSCASIMIMANRLGEEGRSLTWIPSRQHSSLAACVYGAVVWHSLA